MLCHVAMPSPSSRSPRSPYFGFLHHDTDKYTRHTMCDPTLHTNFNNDAQRQASTRGVSAHLRTRITLSPRRNSLLMNLHRRAAADLNFFTGGKTSYKCTAATLSRTLANSHLSLLTGCFPFLPLPVFGTCNSKRTKVSGRR